MSPLCAAVLIGASDPPLPLPAALLIAGLTLGFFALVGWGVVRKTQARNAAAFAAELPALQARGFREAPPSEVPPSGLRTIGRTRRALVRQDGSPIWLFECESGGFAINAAYPIRYAAIAPGLAVPRGALLPEGGLVAPAADFTSTFDDSAAAASFEQLLRQVLNPLFPDVAVETDGQVVRLRSIPKPKPVGGAVPVPISLAALADAAGAIRDHLERMAFGGPSGPP